MRESTFRAELKLAIDKQRSVAGMVGERILALRAQNGAGGRIQVAGVPKG